tara:strand:+ start:510 stop:968 length:459 start_codon:yes stop_codon:yes gene_type:complete
MDKEEILINLTVLENLNKDQKIISRGQYINIEPVSIIPEFLRRWHRQDNRNETIKKINLIVNSAIEFINKGQQNCETLIMKKSGSFDKQVEPISIDLSNMKTALKNSLNGIYNLKETYATCTQTCARIDVILNKIRNCIENVSDNSEDYLDD